MTMPEAIKIREDWLQTYQGIRKWQEENAAEATKAQRTLNKATDAGGTDALPFIRIPLSKMKRLLPGDLNKVTVRCNTPIQGAGAAILKMALGELWKEVYKAGEKEVKIAAAVHDELLLLVKEGFEDKWSEKLSSIMEQAEGIWLDYLTPNEGDIPPLAETSVGKKWSEVH
jgi:DNA polymerase I-like protein with 3'-5' exonuclease and polymerase domains